MIVRAPLVEFQTALYQAMSQHIVGYDIYDSTFPVEELVDRHKDMSSVAMAIINDINCVPDLYKFDAVQWSVNVRIDLFQNYQGKKKINEMIDDILTVASSVELEMKGYKVINVLMGNSMVGSAVRSGAITWQQGYVELNYQLSQIVDAF